MATLLLRALFWLPGKNHHTFSSKKTLVNRANFSGPMLAVLIGFHCIHKEGGGGVLINCLPLKRDLVYSRGGA